LPHPPSPGILRGMAVRHGRYNDPARPGDGLRVLVTRYRPRAPRATIRRAATARSWPRWWRTPPSGA